MSVQPPVPGLSLPRLAPRLPSAHKGDYGRALLIGGSRGMGGAIALAGKATLRGGAGLVTLAVPDVCLETIAGFEPCYMTMPLHSDGEGRIAATNLDQLVPLAGRATCVACGPGLGRSPELVSFVDELYQTLQNPMVVDADALNALAARRDGVASPGGERVLTPHLGEFRRLQEQADLKSLTGEEAAEKLALRHHIVLVLKGPQTLITDGRRSVRNTTGNPGMATAGSGDVLTGVITALISQGLSGWDAARLGVHVHGRAGDLAAQQLGQVSLIASDLLDFLAPAFGELEES
ncbi:MAG: NAD(P)H-hydrate dehydratase [Planctomycetaceae bacterium]|nr:NAD(P)H-hydrate dehydratase [Planctomycetaceae bacterium]